MVIKRNRALRHKIKKPTANNKVGTWISSSLKIFRNKKNNRVPKLLLCRLLWRWSLVSRVYRSPYTLSIQCVLETRLVVTLSTMCDNAKKRNDKRNYFYPVVIRLFSQSALCFKSYLTTYWRKSRTRTSCISHRYSYLC